MFCRISPLLSCLGLYNFFCIPDPRNSQKVIYLQFYLGHLGLYKNFDIPDTGFCLFMGLEHDFFYIDPNEHTKCSKSKEFKSRLGLTVHFFSIDPQVVISLSVHKTFMKIMLVHSRTNCFTITARHSSAVPKMLKHLRFRFASSRSRAVAL